MPSDEETKHLGMPSIEPVLETETLDLDEATMPLIYARTAFRAGRIQLVLES